MAGLSSDEPSTSRTPTAVPAVAGPCPHTPPCPPPVCLAPGLRPQGTTQAIVQPVRRPVEPDPAASPGTDGYGVQVGVVRKFAGELATSADAVDTIKKGAPRFEGWDLVPVAGIPAVGLHFVGRLNTITDTWADCAGLLVALLEKDSEKLVRAANNYRAAEEAGTIKTA